MKKKYLTKNLDHVILFSVKIVILKYFNKNSVNWISASEHKDNFI